MKKALPFVFAMLLWVTTAGRPAAAQGLYFNNVVSANCAAATSCTFTFPTVTAASSTAVLTISKVSCRVVATGGIIYAALSKISNTAKLEFLQHMEFTAGSNGTVVYIASIVDTNTQFFVQAGTAPTIAIYTGGPIAIPNPSIDKPTCSVSGVVE